MDNEAFVTELAQVAPNLWALEQFGLSSEEAISIHSSYICRKRDIPLPQPAVGNQILELLCDWDLSAIEVGMVRFPDQPVMHKGNLIIGVVEADPLVMLSDSGEIVVFESGTDNHILWSVARSGAEMLDALIIAARFLEKRAVGETQVDDHQIVRAVAMQCANAAGADQYLDFYMMLVGAESAM